MAHKDPTGLSWSGSPAPRRSGGFVDRVSMNDAPPALAVDPHGVAPTALGRARPSGPQLTVSRLDEGGPADPVQPSGRVRLTPT